jgi:hypothetical protein
VLATRARFETDDEEATIWDEYDNVMTSGMTNGIGYVSFLSAEFEGGKSVVQHRNRRRFSPVSEHTVRCQLDGGSFRR